MKIPNVWILYQYRWKLYSGSPLLRNWILPFTLPVSWLSDHIFHLCISVIYWKSLCFAFSEVFKLCEEENINFIEYFVIDKHFFEQIFQKVEPESFLYEFLNSGDPPYFKQGHFFSHAKKNEKMNNIWHSGIPKAFKISKWVIFDTMAYQRLLKYQASFPLFKVNEPWKFHTSKKGIFSIIPNRMRESYVT